MAHDLLEESGIVKFAGLATGLVTGAVAGPAIFAGAGLTNAGAASVGSGIGALCGYVLVSTFVFIKKRRRDRELLEVANAVKQEAGLR